VTNNESYKDSLLSRLEVEELIKTLLINGVIVVKDTPNSNIIPKGYCKMIRTVDTNTVENPAEDVWLTQDDQYLSEMIRYESETFANLSPSDRETLKLKARERSIRRFQTFVNSNLAYRELLVQYNNNEHLSPEDRQHLIASAQINAIIENNNNNNTSEPQIMSPEFYTKLFAEGQASDTINNASIETISREYDARPHVQPPLHRLTRTVHENPPIVTKQNEQPSRNVKHGHHRLPKFDRDEFIHLVHILHTDVYEAVIAAMAIASSLVDAQAITDHHRNKADKRYRREDKIERKRERLQKKFESSEEEYEEDYRYEPYNPDDSTFENNNNEEEDNNNSRKRKVKSRGTAILKSSNNNTNNQDEDDDVDDENVDDTNNNVNRNPSNRRNNNKK
jgi:hypothetical protein